LPLFDFDAEVPLRDIAAATRQLSTRRAGRALRADCPPRRTVPPNEQQTEIRELVSKFRRELSGREHRQLVFDIVKSKIVKDTTSLITGTAEGVPRVKVLFMLLRLLNKALEVGRGKYAICDVLAENLQELSPQVLRKDPHLDFLSKVSRVGVALKIDLVS
jgi:hypothetical protein